MAFAELGQVEKAWELFSLLNPILHATDEKGARRYKVEPYVVAADVYSMAPHVGRGGWSWYTGSAGWMYRLIVETLFGLSVEVDQLRLNPKLPMAWESLKIHYRYRDTFYHITISRLDGDSPGAQQLVLDGKPLVGDSVSLVDDHQDHTLQVKVGMRQKEPGAGDSPA